MSKRYILVPHPATVETPQGTFIVPWKDAMKSFFTDPRIQQVLDYEDRARVREAFLKASKGDVIELEDVHWAPIAELVKRPHTLRSEFLDSPGGVAMLDAIRNASTKHPTTKK